MQPSVKFGMRATVTDNRVLRYCRNKTNSGTEAYLRAGCFCGVLDFRRIRYLQAVQRAHPRMSCGLRNIGPPCVSCMAHCPPVLLYRCSSWWPHHSHVRRATCMAAGEGLGP